MNKPKFSVLLPITNFPMKADLPKREPEFLSLWERNDLYQKMVAKNAPAREKKASVLHDGPPYANGHLHMGHALNKILKDITVKYKSAQGFYSPYIPGWDCHGLPIEHQLMKEKGWNKRKVGRVPFRQEATRYAEHWVGIQKQEFKRLGILADWDHPYKTLTPDYEAGIAKTFFDLLEKGCIYRDKKPVYWCAFDETALAEAEVEYENKTSPSIFVKFPIVEWPQNEEAQKLAKAVGKRISVLVWTTTPWTLPANVALAFHPEQTYRVWDNGHDKYLVGEPGWRFLNETLGEGKKDPLTIDGLYMEGLLAKNPLNNNDSQGVLAEFVSSEDGTGVVHIAPGHGQDDYIVGREYGLQILSPVNESGRFSAEVMPNSLSGQLVWDANALIIEMLTKSQMLLKELKITHSYPHCWRCKNPILFRATEQWFLRVDDAFRKKLLDSVNDVNWIPEYGQERIKGMLKTRPDWCLSRQRYWGAPVPMFTCEGCKSPLVDKKVFEHVVSLFRQHGSNAWFEKETAEILPAGTKCAKCGKTEFRKEDDILDVWFDSGVSFVSVLQTRKETTGIPRENIMYLEGSDQHRGWFQTSLLPSVALTGQPPYRDVLTHGFVVDGSGRKMSKSLGNVIAPQEILEKYGADIIRLWVSMSDYREDVRLSNNILERVVDTYRKLRNTLRFMLGNLGDFDPAKNSVPLEKMEIIDLAALGALNKTIHLVKKHYDEYEFHQVSSALSDHFCINVLSEYYLDVQKDLLYCDVPDSPRRRSAQTAFLIITKALAQLMAPLLSFTAEEVWQTLREQKLLGPAPEFDSIFLHPFPEEVALPRGKSYVMSDFVQFKRALNESLEKARQAGTLKGANDAHITVTINAGHKPFSEMSSEMLTALMGVAKLTAEVSSSGNPVSVKSVEKAPGEKCNRCWISHILTPEGLCERCVVAEKAVVSAQA